MNRLRYISISHKIATLVEREQYHFSEEAKKALLEKIPNKFEDINGLLILVTCNRTEIYFESKTTSAADIRDFIMESTVTTQMEREKDLFRISDEPDETIRQFLEVSSGLASSVLGDVEIIHQIRLAYQQSYALQLQGSLLERSMQTIFKAHKRISNETGFRDGTTSVAYKSLKLIANNVDSSRRDSVKILFVGAGDIVKQLLNYNNKFGFNSVYIANRTEQKALDLTQKYGGRTFPWDRVLANEFEDFEVIVTAVSNCPNLVHTVGERNRKTLLLDLAVPGNIDKRISVENNIVNYDLDGIARVLEENRHQRFNSIKHVNTIINEELNEYLSWLNDAPKRELMSNYKNDVDRWVNKYVQKRGIQISQDSIQTATNRIVRKSFKEQGAKIPEWEMESILTEHI